MHLKRFLAGAAGTAILLGVLWFLLHQSLENTNTDHAREKKEKENTGPKSDQVKIVAKKSELLANLEKAKSSLAERHNAMGNWTDAIVPRGSWGEVFCIDLQDALVRDDKRPVIFLGSLVDVWREGSTVVARFSFYHVSCEGTDDTLEYGVEFSLRCDAAMAHKLLTPGNHGGKTMDIANRTSRLLARMPDSSPPYEEDDLLVVARVYQVRRPTFSVSAKATQLDGVEPDAHVELDSGRTFLASGECLDLVWLGDLERVASQ